jgi:hypothetical protein
MKSHGQTLLQYRCSHEASKWEYLPLLRGRPLLERLLFLASVVSLSWLIVSSCVAVWIAYRQL